MAEHSTTITHVAVLDAEGTVVAKEKLPVPVTVAPGYVVQIPEIRLTMGRG